MKAETFCVNFTVQAYQNRKSPVFRSASLRESQHGLCEVHNDPSLPDAAMKAIKMEIHAESSAGRQMV